jgi:hypothetical protein
MVTMYFALKRLRFHYFNHFTALVYAALGACAMRPNLLMAIRAIRQLRHFQGIMGSAG